MVGKANSSHTHDDRYYTESEIDSKITTINNSINNKANSSHTHDDRYYTESEIDSKITTINNSINNKANSSHTHDDRYYTESEIDSKLSGDIITSGGATRWINGDISFGSDAWIYDKSVTLFGILNGLDADRNNLNNTIGSCFKSFTIQEFSIGNVTFNQGRGTFNVNYNVPAGYRFSIIIACNVPDAYISISMPRAQGNGWALMHYYNFYNGANTREVKITILALA